MRILGVLIAAAALCAMAGSASAATLYDQLGNQADGAGSSTPSYFYENGTGDEQAADDFTVPAGQTWQVTGAQAPGVDNLGDYEFRVTIFGDAGNGPGGQVFRGEATVPAVAPTYTFPLSGVPALQPGHYWVSIQLMNLVAWSWANRTVQSGSPAMWQNPDGSDGEPECVTWNLRTTCESETAAFPDQAFSILGDSAPIPAAATIVKKKKCKKSKRKHKRSAGSAKGKKCKKHKKKQRSRS